MIDVHTAATANGHKVTIALGESQLPSRVTAIEMIRHCRAGALSHPLAL